MPGAETSTTPDAEMQMIWRRMLRVLRVFALSFAAWALVAIVLATQSHFANAIRGQPSDYWPNLAYAFSFYAVWALLTPGVLRLSTAITATVPSLGGRIGAHIAAAAGWAVIQTGLFSVFFFQEYGPQNDHENVFGLWRGMLAAQFSTNIIIYGVICGAQSWLEAKTAARRRAEQAATLEAQLSRAELAALRAQLEPHFLFNALNGITALIARDPKAAEEMTARLGDLLRMALSGERAMTAPLRDEIAFLDAYLAIEAYRYGARLHAVFDIEPDCRAALAPPLILQPLVENAIRHGLAPVDRKVVIRIAARREGAQLILQVTDDGAGAPASEMKEGIGLGNTRRRLHHLYGDDCRFEAAPRANGGFKVRLALPYKTAAGAA